MGCVLECWSPNSVLRFKCILCVSADISSACLTIDLLIKDWQSFRMVSASLLIDITIVCRSRWFPMNRQIHTADKILDVFVNGLCRIRWRYWYFSSNKKINKLPQVKWLVRLIDGVSYRRESFTFSVWFYRSELLATPHSRLRLSTFKSQCTLTHRDVISSRKCSY